jgi:AcrR family transcriptional regulator
MTVERNRSVPCIIGRVAKREPAGAAVLQESVTHAISAAMFHELGETGYARMSVDAVARRAGVGKAAVYRRWPSKQAMLIDLVGDAVRRHTPAIPDTGSISGDIRAFLDVNVAQARYPQVSPIVLDMLAETARNPELATALRDAAAPTRRALADAVLQRAIDRGELAGDVDHELGIDLLISPLLFRLLITGDSVTDDYLTRLTGMIIGGLRA